jgi:hypothetical protein
MIDLTKPIETVEDGRPARVIGLLPFVINPDENGFKPVMVWVEGDRSDCGWGNVFLVNHEGFRVDDRALFSARQEPFVRNVKVKKEGWVLMRPYRKTMDSRYLVNDQVYNSETDAQMAMAYYSSEPEIKPVYLTWEE